jgi:hypothetical protein
MFLRSDTIGEKQEPVHAAVLMMSFVRTPEQMDSVKREVKSRMDKLDTRVDKLDAKLDARMDKLVSYLDARMDRILDILSAKTAAVPDAGSGSRDAHGQAAVAGEATAGQVSSHSTT